MHSRRQRRRAERPRRRAVDHELEIYLVVGQVHEIEGQKDRLKLAREKRCVFGADAEGDQRASVAEHGVADVGIKLREILVRQDHAHPELAQLGEHVRD